MLLEEGTVLSNLYRVVKHIGSGAMGQVYLVENIKTGEEFAMKEIMFGSGLDYENSQKLFYREAKLMKKFSHPGIPRMRRIFKEKGREYLLMDYMKGENLESILKKSPVINKEEAIRWAIDILDILDYLHTSFKTPVVYKDLKPSNVIINPEGKATLVDFGISRHYKPDQDTDTFRLASPGYMAPEHFSGRGQTSPRTDIYCLGAILYQMLTGRDPTVTPFKFPSMSTLDPSISTELEQVISRAIRLNPAERYETVKEFREKLESLLDSKAYEAEEKKEGKKNYKTNFLTLSNNIIYGYCKNIFLSLSLNFFYPFPVSEEDIFLLEDEFYFSRIKKLLKRNPALINMKHRVDGYTPLHLAVDKEMTGIVRFLLRHKADVNAIDRRGRTPLNIAEEKKNIALVEILKNTAG